MSHPTPGGPSWYEQAYAPDDTRARTSSRAWWFYAAAFLVVLVSAVLALVRVPYVVLSPGPVTDTLGGSGENRHVQVSGTRTYPTTGHLWFTTVNVLGGPQRHITGWEAARALLSDRADLLPEDAMFPSGSTDQDVQQQRVDEMLGSQEAAIAVALRGTGHKVGEEARVVGLAPKSPATGKVRVGDVVRSVDGTPVATMGAAIAAIRSHEVGEQVRLGIRRDGADRQVRVRTVDNGGNPAVGLYLQPKYTYPFTVRIDSGDVGGPSAGMMFSLAVRDEITPGSLTGGKAIAGTGTLADDGTVGSIGGIRYKMLGARSAGADWFLAPRANCEDVRGHVPAGLRVVAVATHGQAVKAVEAIARDDTAQLPTC